MAASNLIADFQLEFRQYRRLSERAMVQLDDEAFFRRPGEQVNSVALIVKHLSGNLLSRWTDFLTTDGEKPSRNRDDEFILVAGRFSLSVNGTLASRLGRRGEHASNAPRFRSAKNHHDPRRATYRSASTSAAD